MNFISGILAGVGSLLANCSSVGCIALFFDEPECPKELIK